MKVLDLHFHALTWLIIWRGTWYKQRSCEMIQLKKLAANPSRIGSAARTSPLCSSFVFAHVEMIRGLRVDGRREKVDFDS